MIELIFEHGVFRPLEPVELPEGTRLKVELPPTAGTAPEADLDSLIHESLSRRYRSGHIDTAARHNEHQP